MREISHNTYRSSCHDTA